MADIIRPDGFILPNDLVNTGVRCHDCGSAWVVYAIAVPDPGFPLGSYCYKCLLQRCGAAHKLPVPMEIKLRNALERDLGITQPGKRYIFVPDSTPFNPLN